MVKLKLIKARSYSGLVKATTKQPYVEVEAEKDAQALVATGYFEVCASDAAGADTEQEDSSPDYEALSEMTKAELTRYAEDNGISLDGCKTKADILEAISAANGGSYTMMELQQ